MEGGLVETAEKSATAAGKSIGGSRPVRLWVRIACFHQAEPGSNPGRVMIGRAGEAPRTLNPLGDGSIPSFRIPNDVARCTVMSVMLDRITAWIGLRSPAPCADA